MPQDNKQVTFDTASFIIIYVYKIVFHGHLPLM